MNPFSVFELRSVRTSHIPFGIGASLSLVIKVLEVIGSRFTRARLASRPN